MLMLKVLAHPLDEVVFEYTFDELVEEVRSYQFVDVRTREMLSEWLGGDHTSQNIWKNKAGRLDARRHR
jgi:hypothetical protein